MAATPNFPLNGIGDTITVNSGTFNMTGYTATGYFESYETGVIVPLTLVVAGNGLSGSYTRVGGEFLTSGPGAYSCQLKVTQSGQEFYSLIIANALVLDAKPLG